jgi:hypothetical protein
MANGTLITLINDSPESTGEADLPRERQESASGPHPSTLRLPLHLGIYTINRPHPWSMPITLVRGQTAPISFLFGRLEAAGLIGVTHLPLAAGLRGALDMMGAQYLVAECALYCGLERPGETQRTTLFYRPDCAESALAGAGALLHFTRSLDHLFLRRWQATREALDHAGRLREDYAAGILTSEPPAYYYPSAEVVARYLQEQHISREEFLHGAKQAAHSLSMRSTRLRPTPTGLAAIYFLVQERPDIYVWRDDFFVDDFALLTEGGYLSLHPARVCVVPSDKLVDFMEHLARQEQHLRFAHPPAGDLAPGLWEVLVGAWGLSGAGVEASAEAERARTAEGYTNLFI